MSKTAKLFKNGASQAVRLPAEFRFEKDEVFIDRDPITGNVILSAVPMDTWEGFFQVRDRFVSATNFMEERPANGSLRMREVF